MSSTLSTISEEEVLAPRGGRIKWRVHLDASRKWTDLRKTVEEELRGDSSIQDQLQRAGIWLVQETEDEGSEIEKRISYLEKLEPTVEAEWSVGFWQKYFFKDCSPHGTILRIHREKRQTHTLKRKNSGMPSTSDHGVSSSTQENEEKPTENRYPPLLPNKQLRHSVLVSETPYDIDPDRLKNGYAFSDISYAIDIGEDVSQEDLVLIRSLPTIRLYKDVNHYLEGEKVEIKPLKNEHWSGDQTCKFAVHSLTLTGMTMLHEYLKLCYMSSKDEDFFPEPEDLSIHLIVAVGYTASHYIHRIRHEPVVRQPLKYESYWLASFNLKEAGERNRFRERLNEIHVLHVTAFKKVVKEKLEEVLALGKREICRRLKERTHKGVRFLRTVRNDVWGFGVKCDGENPTIPTPPPSKMRSTTSNITKAQEFKDDKGGALAAFIPQTSTLEERTKDGRPRCRALQQRSKLQCKNTARKFQLSCRIKAHQRLVKDQLADSP